ncbi:MAG: hypothetical protein ACK5WL_02605, partial [Pseudanabaena sp.]
LFQQALIVPLNYHYKKRFVESPPQPCLQQTDFGISSTFGAGNTKIRFIMRIADLYQNTKRLCHFVN